MKKIIYTIIGLSIIVGGLFASVHIYNAYAASRTGLVLDLNFGNNNGSATPTVFDSSGYGRNATSTAGASSPTCTNKFCDFDGTSDYMDETMSVLASSFAIAIKFSPDFATNENVSRYILDGDGASRNMIISKTSNTGDPAIGIGTANALVFGPVGVMMTVAESTYAPYWKVGKENILIFSATTGNNKAWLNGVRILNTTDSWTFANSAKVMIGCDYAKSLTHLFDGKIHYLKVWNRLLTDDEVANLSANAVNNVQAPSRTGLVGYWTMDANDMSANGATLYDKSGLGNNGTVSGTTTSTGKIAQARSFNGTSDNISKSSKFISSGNFTFSLWAKTQDTDALLMGEEGIASTRMGFITTGAKKVQFSANAFAGADVITSTSTIADNKWHFIAATYNGTDQNLYIDGVLEVADAVTPDYSATQFIVGYNTNAGGTSYLSGSLDDVRIYNRALSAQEVANLYNAAKTNYVATPVKRTGLVLDLNFGNNNGASAPTVYDTSGFNRHATSTAGATSPTCGGKFCDFDGGDVMGVNTAGVFDSSVTNLSFAIKFSPDFAADSGISQGIFMADPSAYAFYIRKGTTNLQIAFNNEAVIVQATAVNFVQYWKTGKENVLIFSGTSGSNKVWLNGNPITLVSATGAWTLPNTTWGDIGSGGGGIRFDGKLHYLKVWNRLLTDDEVATISADRRTYLK